MKYLIALTITFLLFLSVNAQRKTSPALVKYEVVADFNSIAAGPPSDDSLKLFISRYARKNKALINAYKLTGCGREGEYEILFSLSRLKTAMKTKFIKGLQEFVLKANEINFSNSKGTINLSYNSSASQHCRGNIVKWDYN